MKKSKAIIILLCALLVLLGVGYVDLYGVDAEGTASASDISLGLDLAGGVSITYQVVGDEEPDATDMADTIAKLQKRVENYSKEAIVYQEGTDRINIEIPGVTDANKILEEEEPFNIFIYADMESKMARCRERAPEDENLTDKELARKIRQVDAARAKTQEMISDFKWGDKKWYHLCVNTSGLPIPKTAALVAEYAKHWFERKERYQ